MPFRSVAAAFGVAAAGAGDRRFAMVFAMKRSSLVSRRLYMPCSGCMGVLVSRCSLWALCSVLGVGYETKRNEYKVYKIILEHG
jgi:cytidine deaminase